LSVKLRNTGPTDIASDHFNDRTPFRIDIHASVYGLTEVSHPTVTEVDVSTESTAVSLKPMLLRRGAEWAFEAIVQGDPAPEHSSSLIDTDVFQARASDYRERRRDVTLALVGAAGAVVAALITTIATVVITHNDNGSDLSRTGVCLKSKLPAVSSTGRHTEVPGGPASTWSDPCAAGGNGGPRIPAYRAIQVSCVVQGFRVADGNTWWYRVASPPWRGEYFVSADSFYNNGRASGSLQGTPFVDPEVPRC
jgi:hypothetical protein